MKNWTTYIHITQPCVDKAALHCHMHNQIWTIKLEIFNTRCDSRHTFWFAASVYRETQGNPWRNIDWWLFLRFLAIVASIIGLFRIRFSIEFSRRNITIIFFFLLLVSLSLRATTMDESKSNIIATHTQTRISHKILRWLTILTSTLWYRHTKTHAHSPICYARIDSI